MWKKDCSIQTQMHYQQIKIHKLEQEKEELEQKIYIFERDKNQMFAHIDKLKQEKEDLMNMLGEMLRYFEPDMNYPDPHEYLKIPKQARVVYEKYKK